MTANLPSGARKVQWCRGGLCNRPANNNNCLEEGMKRLHSLWIALVGLVLLLPATALAAGGKAAQVVIVADTRRLDGIMLWWAQMYNDSHLYFTILTIIIIPVTGCIFGFLADVVMNHIGIDLKNRELAEH